MSAQVIRYTNSFEEACRLRDEGYEPVECAFGGHGSVLGPLAMDHHGTESWRQGVAIRAFGDDFGARERDPRFVVTGTPDADATLAIVGLAAAIPRDLVPDGFVQLVDEQDTAPIGLDLTTHPFGPWLLKFNQTELPRGEEGFRMAVAAMLALLRRGIPEEDLRHILGRERSRIERADKAVVAVFEAGGLERPPEKEPPPAAAAPASGRVALVQSTVWGFDRWYRFAPVVVSFSTRLRKVTVGCRDQETAEAIFGEGGLLTVYPALGQGWGGREAVGGSPRGVHLTMEDARRVARMLSEQLGDPTGCRPRRPPRSP